MGLKNTAVTLLAATVLGFSANAQDLKKKNNEIYKVVIQPGYNAAQIHVDANNLSLQELRNNLLAMLNEQRVQKDSLHLKPLENDAELDSIAQQYVEDLASHDDGTTLQSKIADYEKIHGSADQKTIDSLSSAHYAELGQTGRVSHTSGGVLKDRMADYSKAVKIAAENISYSKEGVENSVAGSISGQMTSPEHRKNILSREYTRIGIGYKDGTWVYIFVKLL